MMIMTQLRHMFLAEWSGKGTVENQEDIFLFFQVTQSKGVS
jgi:hypothetical protein